MITHQIRSFVESCPPDYDFPIGGSTPLLTAVEMELLAGLSDVTESELGEIRAKLTMREAYSLVIFAIRLAVYGVRTNNPEALKSGLVALCIDEGKADWRDLLGALGMIEDCSKRLGVNFELELCARADEFAAFPVKETISGYLEREDEMRDIKALGFRAVGVNSSLKFEPTT